MNKRLDTRGTWRSFNTIDGLASLRAEHLAFDQDGYLWCCTWDSGVSRFENFSKQHGLTSNEVYAVCPDHCMAVHRDALGCLWLGGTWTDGREFRYGRPRLFYFDGEHCTGADLRFAYGGDGEGRKGIRVRAGGYSQGQSSRNRLCDALSELERDPQLRGPGVFDAGGGYGVALRGW